MNDELEFTGALLDPRPTEQKERDWLAEEVVGSASPVVWVDKKKYKYFSKRNQSSSGSCGSQAVAKLMTVENFNEEGIVKDFSAKPIYQSRTNKGAGMFQQEALQGAVKPSTCFEGQLPSQGMNEAQMNEKYAFTDEMKEVAETYKASKYVQIQNYTDIDRIASVTEDGKGVMLMFYFTSDEYWREIPIVRHDNLDRYSPDTSRHFVAAVDYTMYQGEKALIIEDSAGNSSSINKKGQRIITEEFLKSRCMGAGYLIDLPNKRVLKPEFEYKGLLKFGMKGNQIESLQNALKYEKVMDSKIPSTGSFLTITRQAVKDFQKKYNLVADGIVGKMTGAKLEELYPLK